MCFRDRPCDFVQFKVVEHQKKKDSIPYGQKINVSNITGIGAIVRDIYCSFLLTGTSLWEKFLKGLITFQQLMFDGLYYFAKRNETKSGEIEQN